MRILVCNRGEIACRIIKTIKECGHEAVGVYSKEDKDSYHVSLCDYSACIGEKDAATSYLNIANILIVATSFNVDAIHPGYGFLSENSDFARLVEELNIKFVGPSSENIIMMGDKINALKTVKKATPYFDEQLFLEFRDKKQLSSLNLNYPVILKYANGGGGRGIKKVFSESELEDAYDKVYFDAKQEDSNPQFYVEELILEAKHIEVQIIGDNFGNIVHLSTRDCSIQRRGQKIIEEAPAIINKDIENKLIDASLKIAKAIGYRSLGTFEYLVKGDKIFFLEMNTRIQVEHSVTEMITGIDLVKLQFEIAENKKLSIKQKDVAYNTHAIELRVNAEDPLNGFLPSPGEISKLNLVNEKDVRYDFGYRKSDKINPHFDSLIGKIIVKSSDRENAIKKLVNVLENTKVGDIKTNVNYALDILNSSKYKNGSFSINFIEEEHENTK